ncbi:hypothetical protein [Roseomonas sp. 18066]|uniref:hypothetical protein n=1 Tax=Roseomonas sp. 18066 TaxID=2681412 RepID=UPI00135A6A46|nr:hypothetical protein [Roseomonas sp. 18066]
MSNVVTGAEDKADWLRKRRLLTEMFRPTPASALRLLEDLDDRGWFSSVAWRIQRLAPLVERQGSASDIQQLERLRGRLSEAQAYEAVHGAYTLYKRDHPRNVYHRERWASRIMTPDGLIMDRDLVPPEILAQLGLGHQPTPEG